MVFQVELPQVGESVTEGVIGKWLVSEGDRVAKYEPLVEIITDKVNMEMPSPVSGVIAKIIAPEGETLPMGAVIAEIDADEGQVATATPEKPADTLGSLIQGVAVGPTGAANVPQQGDQPAPDAPVPVTGSVTGSGTAAQAQPQSPGNSAPKGRYSPAVRRLAQERGIDLSRVRGTGIGGRVTRKDVEGHTGGQEASDGPGDRRVTITPVRRMIADNMVRSASEIPHVWSTVEVDVTGLAALRKAIKEEFRAASGHPITYLAFAISAAARALREHPMFNARWDGDHITLRGRVNIGIAVATPDALLVPVILDADKRTVAELAGEIDRLTGAARANTLRPQDVQGGTFTVNNTGALGSVTSGPLIVPGQAAIITTETVVKRPVVMAGDEIAVRSMMNMCLSFDHRLLDGSDAGAFLKTVRESLEAVGPEMALEGLKTALDGPIQGAK
jgi:2-oxoisovalerate dehydrogenase E2 component (dihydrolipoyl transacylase)